jgi:phosphate transport system substrate-binding protein
MLKTGSPGFALLAFSVITATACGPAAQPTPVPPTAAKPTEAPKPAAAAEKPTALPTRPGPAGPPLPAAVALTELPQGATVRIDGSSTVFPVTEAMAEEFQKATNGRVRVTVGISGTGGGFQKFCNDETDVSNASRPISPTEVKACLGKNINFVELPVAFDGLSVVTSPRNTFLDCIKKSELKKMWEPEAQGKITRWNQIRPEWPDQELKLFGAGTDSGTFDYFTDAINGREKASRGDYTASEDDNVLVQGVANDANALGYFGFAYYEENQDKLKLVGIDNETGGGCVKPSPQTINSGSYQPLSRPIFVYAKAASLDKPEVREFLRFYIDPKNATTLIDQVGYVPFGEQFYTQGLQRLNGRQQGTLFPGGTRIGVKLEELFQGTPVVPQ